MASAKITLSSGDTITVSGSVHEVMATLSRGRWVEFVNADGEQVAVNPFLGAVGDRGAGQRRLGLRRLAQPLALGGGDVVERRGRDEDALPASP